MGTNTEVLHREAEQALESGDAIGALRQLIDVLSVAPEDHRARTTAARALAAVDRKKEAAAAFAAAGAGFARLGLVLEGIAAISEGLAIAPGDAALVGVASRVHREIAGRASTDGGGVRAVLPIARRAVSTAGGEDPAAAAETPERIISRAAELAAKDAKARDPWAPPSTPAPLFAALSEQSFLSLLTVLRHRILAADAEVMRQGEPGESVCILVRGEATAKRSHEGREVTLGKLGPGALFGEMALFAAQPRSATVTTTKPSAIFEIGRAALQSTLDRHPELGQQLLQFARQRMVRTLLATSRLLEPFDEHTKLDILRRFSSKVVPEGAVILEQGGEPSGLYLIANGEVQVTKQDDAGNISFLGTLDAGATFGEISLIEHTPVTATAMAMRQTLLFHLDRDRFADVAEQFPAVRTYLERLSFDRIAADNKTTLAFVTNMDGEDLLLI